MPITQEEVIAVVAKYNEDVPREIWRNLEDVDIIVCVDVGQAKQFLLDECGGEAIPEGEGPQFTDDVKGLFYGEQMETEEGDSEEEETVTLPDGYIFLISANLDSTEEAAKVLLHEVGHALGMDESDVNALGLGVESPNAEKSSPAS